MNPQVLAALQRLIGLDRATSLADQTDDVNQRVVDQAMIARQPRPQTIYDYDRPTVDYDRVVHRPRAQAREVPVRQSKWDYIRRLDKAYLNRDIIGELRLNQVRHDPQKREAAQSKLARDKQIKAQLAAKLKQTLSGVGFL